jgi:uncharacterized protein (UPF0261 family)
MVNFGPKGTVPGSYKARKLLEHNPTVTLMRTTREECRMIGNFIVEKIKGFAGEPEKVEVWIPRGGVSMIATPGQVFEDQDADAALAKSLKEGLRGTGVKVVEDMRDINDPGFAVDMAENLMKIVHRAK